MFITGPEVVKTVTGEEVTFEELGGATTHATSSGVAHLTAPERGGGARRRPLPPLVPAAEQPGARRRPRSRPIPSTVRSPSSTRLVPDAPTKPYDIRDVVHRVVDDGEFLEIQPSWAENIVCGFARLGGHPIGVVANNPKALAGHARHRRLREGRPLRPHVRRVQRPARHVRRRPRLPAGHGTGVGRHHPPRRQAPVRVLRGDRAEDHADHAQGLRRRLRRHELEAHPGRLQLRLADRGGRRHGPGGRRQHRLPPRARGGWPSPRPAAPS